MTNAVEVRHYGADGAVCFPHFDDEDAKVRYVDALRACGGDRGAGGDVLPLANVGAFANRLAEAGIVVTVWGIPAGPGTDLFPPGFDSAEAGDGAA